jgi:glycosyltransferase involved in cell wall biosynthesis
MGLCVPIAALPALLMLRNRTLFQPPSVPRDSGGQQPKTLPKVSVLIPARNEASSISHSLHGALQNEGVELEVLVLDDDSQDATPDIVSAVAARDTRVRLLQSVVLPAGWNGKQHACARLAEAAAHEELLFIDADVRLSRDAIARLVDQRSERQVALLSAFPHQETGTFWERLLIPLMHYILLGYLPLDRMRQSSDPAFAAGCGQLFLTDRDSYQRAGTHAAIRSSRHDGVRLPRLYRAAGLMTDVCDGTPIARCRMYHSAAEVFRGLLKNADEGLATPRLIGPFTVLLVGGSVLPWVGLGLGLVWQDAWAVGLAALASLLGWLPRWLAARRYRQSKLGALLHPLSIAVFVTLQWVALSNALRGKRVAWRGRVES